MPELNVLIVEDEAPAARRLQKLIQEIVPDWCILDVIDSVEDATSWLKTHENPQLIFMDIQLADGISFHIFEHISVKVPIIFTTAYDEYAIKAFQVNSIDYLLKPIDKQALKDSIHKFQELFSTAAPSTTNLDLLLTQLQERKLSYKDRFLVKMGDRLVSIEQNQVAYFMAEDKIVLLVTSDEKRFAIDYTLEKLENLLNPKAFFRLNRKFIARFNAISQVHQYFNGKLKVELVPLPPTEVLVSREKSAVFKGWLDC
ncbi:MAG: LytR/AlgR family response regulator transcription factor [Thermonemataceae bacterium]